MLTKKLLFLDEMERKERKNEEKKLSSQKFHFGKIHDTIKIFMVSGKLHFFNVFLPILVYDFQKWTFIFVHFSLAG